MTTLLVPMVPARRDFLYLLKEWAYAGFAITLVSALIAYLALGDGVEKWAGRRGPGFSGACRTSSSVGSKRVCQKQWIAHEKSTYPY